MGFYDGNMFFLGNILFARLLAGTVYMAHVPEGSNVCIGAECYFLSHLIVLVTCAAGVVSALIVGHKSTALYKDIQASSDQVTPLLNSSNGGKGGGSHALGDFGSKSHAQ